MQLLLEPSFTARQIYALPVVIWISRAQISTRYHESKSEMVTYLTNVFKVMYCVNVATRAKFGTVTPETLAMATTEDAFDHNDVNHDNLLSFDEFQHWYVLCGACGGVLGGSGGSGVLGV